MANTEYPKRRRYIRVFENAHELVSVVNYCADNSSLNSFFHNFDAWNGYGRFQISSPMKGEEKSNYQEVWFEMPIDFMDFAKSDLFKFVMQKFDVEILYGNERL